MLASLVLEIAHRNPATAEQIGKCTKCYDCQARQNYYLVENSKAECDADGNIIEYAVRYSKETGFTCDCKAGQNGRLCWHIRASIACAEEERAAMQEQVALSNKRAHYLEIGGREATNEEYSRVMDAVPGKAYTGPNPYRPRPFCVV